MSLWDKSGPAPRTSWVTAVRQRVTRYREKREHERWLRDVHRAIDARRADRLERLLRRKEGHNPHAPSLPSLIRTYTGESPLAHAARLDWKDGVERLAARLDDSDFIFWRRGERPPPENAEWLQASHGLAGVAFLIHRGEMAGLEFPPALWTAVGAALPDTDRARWSLWQAALADLRAPA